MLIYSYLLNDYVGGKVVIAYSARLNEKAKINQLDNNNGVTLEYTKDSKVASEPGKPVTTTDTDKTYTYTFDIDGSVAGSTKTTGIITKYGEDENSDGTNDPLNGAVFALYTADPTNLSGDDLTNAIYKNYKVNPDGSQGEVLFNGTTITSKDGGQLPIKGLAAGTMDQPATYYLKETSAPPEYSVNTHVFKIEIGASYITEEGNNKGKLKEWIIKIDNEPVNTFTVNHTGATPSAPDFSGKTFPIQNTKISSLPSTGGIGTTIFTIGGCAIMILAAGLYFASRRKSAK